jgi:peptide-methionine (S)-S-oxide reductase
MAINRVGLIATLMLVLGGHAMAAETKTAILAGGCFWCLEPPFDKARGVTETQVGYTGGEARTATYEQVGHGDTGHREAIRITYDPTKVTYPELLEIFWNTIDPTDADGQYADRGFHYTTAIYVNSAEERDAAEASKAAWEKKLGKPIPTIIEDAKPFYPAEDYHQEYYKKNSLQYNLYKHGSGRK